MIDERRIEDKTKYGMQFDVGNITLYVTTEFWGGRWHIPTIQLAITPLPPPLAQNVREVSYAALEDLAEVFPIAQREWESLDCWASQKNEKISQNSLGAS